MAIFVMGGVPVQGLGVAYQMNGIGQGRNHETAILGLKQVMGGDNFLQ